MMETGTGTMARWRAICLNKKLDEAEGYSRTSGVERGWRYAYYLNRVYSWKLCLEP